MIGRFGKKASEITEVAYRDFGLHPHDVHRMITHSVSHADTVWNRRYGNVLFSIKEDKVVGVKLFDEKKGFCPECMGIGYTIMFDDEEKKNVQVQCECAPGGSKVPGVRGLFKKFITVTSG